MYNAGYATLQVIPSMKGATKAIKQGLQTGDAGSAAGDSVGKRITGRMGSVLKKGALAVGAAAGGVLATALFKGWGRLTNIENATAKLTGLGHSGASVKAIMDNALASVKGTAFGLDEAASTAAGAVASGVKPGKDLERTLKLVGDAATIGGTSMGEMGAIFNKVAASGKIQGDVIAQLGDRGIPILQLLGKEIGKTPQEVAKLASQGKIGFDQFRNAMEKGLGGAALKSGETTQGAFKNMNAALGRFGAKLLGGVFPIAKQVFGGITTFVDNLGARIDPFVQKFSAGLGQVTDVVKLFYGAFTGKGSDVELPYMNQIIDAASYARTLADNARTMVAELAASDRASTALGLVRDVFQRLVETGTILWPAVQELGTALSVASAQIGVSTWDALIIVLDAASQLVVALAPAIASVTSALASNQSVVTALVAGYLAYSAATKAVALWGVITQTYALVTAKYAEVTAWVVAKATIVASVAETIALYAMYAGSAIASATRTAASWVVSAAVTVGAWVMMGVQSLVQAGRMAAAWFIALGPIGWAIAAIVAIVVIVVANWDKISAWTAKTWTAISGWVTSKAQAVLGWLKSNWPLLLAIITGPVGLAVRFVVTHWDKITAGARAMKDATVRKLGELVSFVAGLPGRILAGIGNLGSLLVDKGASIVSGLIRGISNMGGRLAGFVKQFIKDHIPGPVAKALGIASPSKVMAAQAKWIPLGIIEGIDSQRSRLDRTMAGLVKVPTMPSLDKSAFAQPARGESRERFRDLVVNPAPGMDELALATKTVRAIDMAGV